MKLGQPVPLSKFGGGLEQRQPAQTAGINAAPFLREENPAEGRFGAVLEQDVLFVLAEIGDQSP